MLPFWDIYMVFIGGLWVNWVSYDAKMYKGVKTLIVVPVAICIKTPQKSPMFVLLKHGKLGLNILKKWFHVANVKYSLKLPLAPSESNASFERIFSVLHAV